jgi:hypothetical protein
MILLLLFAGVAGSLISRIPIVMDESGDGFVQAIVPGIYGSSVIDFKLDYAFTACRDALPGTIARAYMSQDIQFVWPNTTARITGFISSVCRSERPRGRSAEYRLGIGSPSQLVGSFGAVDYVKVLRDSQPTSFLQLGNTYEPFTEVYCVADSAFNVTLDGDFTGYAQGYIGGDSSDILTIGFTRIDARLELPSSLFYDLEMRISEHSSRVIQESSRTNLMVFESCGVVREMLDRITITFVSGADEGSPVQGTIVFDPVDYTRVIENDTCELLVQDSRSSTSIDIDLFTMKDVNMQFTRNQITFCDTSL